MDLCQLIITRYSIGVQLVKDLKFFIHVRGIRESAFYKKFATMNINYFVIKNKAFPGTDNSGKVPLEMHRLFP